MEDLLVQMIKIWLRKYVPFLITRISADSERQAIGAWTGQFYSKQTVSIRIAGNMTETTESSAESSCNKHVLPEIKTPAFNETTSPEPKPQTQPENKPPDIEAKTKKPLVRSKQKGKPGFNDQMFQETSYYFKDGLRWVYPYVFTFTAYAKQRWFGLTVLQLFSKVGGVALLYTRGFPFVFLLSGAIFTFV